MVKMGPKFNYNGVKIVGDPNQTLDLLPQPTRK